MSRDRDGKNRAKPEVSEKAVRRRFTAEYKARILDEADRCTTSSQDGRGPGNVRSSFMLHELPRWFCTGIYQNGQGAESIPEPHQNLRNVREADVLPRL